MKAVLINEKWIFLFIFKAFHFLDYTEEYRPLLRIGFPKSP